MKPFVLWAAAASATLLALFLSRKGASGGPPGMPTGKGAAPVPPAPGSALVGVDWGRSPLFLYVYQTNASDWTAFGWYYGELRQAALGGGTGAHTYFFTPAGQIIEALESLKAQGIGGWFDTIEPDGVEDAMWKGRFGPGLDVEVYVPAQPDPQYPGTFTQAHYESRTTQNEYISA